jgi:hypothetical protein
MCRQRLERNVSTYKVIVRLAKNYETLTKWLRAFGIPDGLQYVLSLHNGMNSFKFIIQYTRYEHKSILPLLLHRYENNPSLVFGQSTAVHPFLYPSYA